MSTCPSHDVQSMYIDNELPEPFKSTFEKHVSECLDCSITLQNLKAIHDELQDDADAIQFSQKDIDASFDRLQTKMRFAKVTTLADKKAENLSKSLWRIVPLAAAAVVIAFVIPFRFGLGNSSTVQETLPSFQSQGNAIQAAFVQDKGVISDGNLSHYSIDLSTLDLTAMDLFRPELTSDGQMKITITLTGVANLPVRNAEESIDAESFAFMGINDSDLINSPNLVPVNWKMDTNN